ncbi:MAG TPA: transposase [Anaerolineae bacterium]|nr:transposase [Anaerolineae bacterium]HQH37724.1 transposase [Anaerolineae bacterium]
MPYEYRTMTPEERAAVVAYRRSKGYPLHSPPHPYREGGWYIITAANYEHNPILQPAERRTAFEDQLLITLNAIGEVGAWVILPNHYHVLTMVESLDVLSAALKQLHGTTARTWNLEDALTGQRRVWYKFYDRWVRNEAHYYRALNYIHYNAVKHRYAETPYDWPWSSVTRYVEAFDREWLRVQWKAYPPPTSDFGDVP